ncbi:membrane-associated protein, putative, partial [Bodo saltans]
MTRIVSPLRRRCAFVFAVAFVAMWLTVRSLGGTAAIEPPTLQQDMTMSMASSRLTPPRSVAIGGDTTQQTTTTLVQTEHPVSTVTKKSAAGWQPIDRAVILHADVMDAAAKFLLELGGGPAARYVLVFSDERIFTSALHRLRNDNVVATLILFADCGERLGVARITDLDGTILHDMPVPSCTLGPQHSSVRVARWLSISSGSFLMDSVRVLLTFWFHDTGAVDNSQLILSTDSRIVVIDPLAVRLWKGAHRNFTLTSLMALFSAPPSTVVMARFALGVERLNTTLRFIAPELARWRSRLEKLLDPLPSSSFGGGALDQLATSGQSTLMSPYLFGGGRDALVTLVDSVAELQVRYPMPPGVGMELVLAASLNEVRTGHSSARFAVQLLSEHTVRMASDNRCSVMHTLLRQQEMIASVTPPPPPAMLLNWHHCTWSKPMQPAPVAQPFSHSRWFDDYYLLHEANAKDPARMIPTAVIAPTSLGVAWEEIGKNREGNDAIVLNESMIEEPYLRRCVGRGRSAVLGMCTGYAPELVKTFVKTFAKFHLRSCTQLYLFVDDEQRIAYNEAFGGEADIVIVVIDALKSTLRLQSCGVVNWRKELFYEWLLLKERSEEDANWLRYVMIVDTRDAHFQADPFEPLRKIAPEVRRRLGRVKRTTPTHGAQ